MKKIIALFLVLVMGLTVVGCQNDDLAVETGEVTETPETPDTGDTAGDTEPEIVALTLADEVRINFAMGNNSRTLTYQQATPMTMPDGTIIAQGDLKPTWQYFQSELGFAIKDVTVQDQKSGEMIDLAAATGFTDANVYGGTATAEALMSYGAQGYFINLKEYLQYMPHFNAYLEENPNVAKSITAYDGNIYHVPYVAEIGNYARTFLGREAWFMALLDSKDALVDESETLTVAYEGFVNRNATNVVDLQNAAANGGKLTRDVALDTLLAYIGDTYPSLSKPSDLYLGSAAQFDMDELVALLRVVNLSPNTLSKLETGDVVSGAIISPFFVRQTRFREDALRLVAYFGGQRVFGSDSYDAQLYTDENGVLNYSYAEEGFLEGVEQLEKLYAEGLIHSEFTDLSNKDNFRTIMFGSDDIEDQKQFGFMTIDWIASTTATNDDVVAVLPPLTTYNGNDYIHFIENTRVIKPDGWGISSASTEEEINAAITLFDYVFSPDGYKAQNYGPPAGLVEGETYEAGGIQYPKFNQWLLDTAVELKSGDVAAFLRDFIGSHIPIGYQKEIGFEKQYTNANGIAAWESYETANVLSVTYSSEDPLFRLVPPVFSLTEQDTAKLNTVAVGTDQIDQIFLYITGASNATATASEIKAIYEASGIDAYLEVYRVAFARMTGE